MSHGWPAESAPYCSPSWEGNYPGVQIIPAPVSNQPTIIQQIPAAFAPLSQPIRHGRAKEDLIELMMIQNAQMHQVIMNNMAVSAMSSLGSNSAPAPATAGIILAARPVAHVNWASGDVQATGRRGRGVSSTLRPHWLNCLCAPSLAFIRLFQARRKYNRSLGCLSQGLAQHGARDTHGGGRGGRGGAAGHLSPSLRSISAQLSQLSQLSGLADTAAAANPTQGTDRQTHQHGHAANLVHTLRRPTGSAPAPTSQRHGYGRC
ncbi:proline-rich protein 29 isoform X1 [Ascaphus truei]|uniref:proline-rich protein 29 isoform X1 n=1 Tax=Ascaphus truei TaxID=8439 RepID=UPI003F5AD83F